jgi:thiaminase
VGYECPRRLFLLIVDDMAATIEGIGLIAPLTEDRFEELVKTWRKCVVLEKEFWDMAIALS